MSGVVFVSPVIDKKMMQLSQLVKGQKRTKKKKKTNNLFSGSFNSRLNRNTRKPNFVSTFSANNNNNNNGFRNYNVSRFENIYHQLKLISLFEVKSNPTKDCF